jgi:cytochrome c556
MLWELYREVLRLDEAKAKGGDFVKYATDAEAGAGELEEALKAGDAAGASAAFKKLKKNCDACHSVYRNS